MWEAEHTLQSDKDPQLDALRMDALQAGTAYAMSPCDKTMKANLIAATSAYARGWIKIYDCPNPALGMFCSEKKRDQANAAYSTPLDIRVKAALAEAFEQKGVVQEDFPEDIRLAVFAFAGPGLWSDPSPVCLPRQRATANSK